MTRAFVLFLLVVLFGSPALIEPLRAGPKEPRKVALIVGNADYVHHVALPNVLNDVASVRQRVEDLKFDEIVVAPQRATSDQFVLLDLAPFAATIRPGDVVVFYYSGHGFSYGSENYLVPTGVPASTRRADVQFTFPAESSIRALLQDRNPAFLLMVMDACRSRPGFVQDGVPAGTEKSFGYQVSPPESVSILSATAPGYTASAGAEGARSVFTDALIENVATPGQELSELQGRIVLRMSQASAQKPWFSETRVARLWLNPSQRILDEMRQAWEAARDSRRRTDVANYLAWYATGPYAADAREWLATHKDEGPLNAEVSPVAVDTAWTAAATSGTYASVAVSDGFRVGSNVEVSRSIRGAEELRAAVRTNPFGMTSSIRATKALGGGAIRNGAVVDVSSARGEIDPGIIAILNQQLTTRSIGRAQAEVFLAPDPDGSGATVSAADIQSLLNSVRSAGARVAWVSLATSRGKRSETVPAVLMAADVRAKLIRAGVPRERITSVSETPEEFDGVRIRIFSQ